MQEKTKKIIANTVTIVIVLMFTVAILFSKTKPASLQGGNIQKTIETGQYK